jgi:Response regulator containing CheY-like receiver, AAA-type ATPase, and DNA-binding domains
MDARPRVLVVDDEAPIRALVRGYLELEGFEVREAETGPAAVADVREWAPELVILDVMLPGVESAARSGRSRMRTF